VPALKVNANKGERNGRRGGSLSAARIKADYDMIKNRNFLTYGPVENGRGAE